MVGIALVAIAATALLPGLLHGESRAARGRVTPVPTATAPPALTTLPGFRLLDDSNAGFRIQYPESWQSQQNENGLNVTFFDNANQPTYQFQVGQPDDPSQCGQSDVATASACWVDYVLGSEQPKLGDQFKRLNGPIPPATIGGQTWQSGIALIQGQQADQGYRWQVFATVWSGTPYIIGLSATDDVFSQGEQRYFRPMLQSFQFLPDGS